MEEVVSIDAADFSRGGREAGKNAGGDEESGGSLLLISPIVLDVLLFVHVRITRDKLLIFARFASGALLAPLAEKAPVLDS